LLILHQVLPGACRRIDWRLGGLLVYLSFLVSRGIEKVTTMIGVNTHLTIILVMVSLLAALFTEGVLKSAGTPVVVRK
jgi:hypothetical protein